MKFRVDEARRNRDLEREPEQFPGLVEVDVTTLEEFLLWVENHGGRIVVDLHEDSPTLTIYNYYLE